MVRPIDRRRFLEDALQLSSIMAGASLLASCGDVLQGIAQSCPADRDDIGFVPDVLHPVFYGWQDLSTADGAPTAMRIWYPTHEGFVDDAPILRLCAVRWPVVLFLHGQPPGGCADPDYYRKWITVPMRLARSGYVVVVPSYAPHLEMGPGAPIQWLEWVRSSWEHRSWIDPRLEATAVVGHSYGAFTAGRFAVVRPTIAAYVSLGGRWTDPPDQVAILSGITAPSFFMWSSRPIDVGFESLDYPSSLWSYVREPKLAAVQNGGHFDYIGADYFAVLPSTCNALPGSCALVESVAADLVALFMSRFMPVPFSRVTIPNNLRPTPVTLTRDQELFAGGHLTAGCLSGLSALAGRTECVVDLRWHIGTDLGSRRLGSPAECQRS